MRPGLVALCMICLVARVTAAERSTAAIKVVACRTTIFDGDVDDRADGFR